MVEHETVNNDSQAQARGHRLQLAIYISHNTLVSFAQKNADVGLTSLYNWTRGRTNLTTRSAQKIVQALHQEGYYCSEEWLLEGTGVPPTTIQEYQHGQTSYTKNIHAPNKDQESLVLEEIRGFQVLHGQALTLCLEDNVMEPLFKKGDYVAGPLIKQDCWSVFFNLPCIVEVQGYPRMARTVDQGSANDLYNLTGLNSRAGSRDFHIPHVTILKLAPIVWHRFHIQALKQIATQDGLLS